MLNRSHQFRNTKEKCCSTLLLTRLWCGYLDQRQSRHVHISDSLIQPSRRCYPQLLAALPYIGRILTSLESVVLAPPFVGRILTSLDRLVLALPCVGRILACL